ncbi:MAG: 3-oxoacyl-[acyl-carrier-protein] reductase [Actinobacteria bacterium]|nr:3-oxoacyl-[acyl-carrier-protein] reductase [Actinomycetota bacterium]
MSFNGKVSLVTGAGQGIGRSIAASLAAKGSTVFVNDINEKTIEKTCLYIKNQGHKCYKAIFNVSDFDEVEKMFEFIYSKEARLDILVNNAGILRDITLQKMSEKDWDDVIAVNLKSVFNCCKAALAKMIENSYGRIINISSVIGLKGNFGQTNYAASKAGIIGFSKSLSYETAKKGITVNVVAPGVIETDILKAIPDNIMEKIISNIPMGYLGKPDDIANMVVFLASGEASYITGQVFNVNGGYLMP